MGREGRKEVCLSVGRAFFIYGIWRFSDDIIWHPITLQELY